jgi:hypothetical protein
MGNAIPASNRWTAWLRSLITSPKEQRSEDIYFTDQSLANIFGDVITRVLSYSKRRSV